MWPYENALVIKIYIFPLTEKCSHGGYSSFYYSICTAIYFSVSLHVSTLYICHAVCHVPERIIFSVYGYFIILKN